MNEVIKYARKCSECGRGMNEGYVVGGDNYYCSEDCLHKHFTPEEWLDECMEYDERFDDASVEYADDMIVGDWSYYTEWGDDSEMRWIEVNGVLESNLDY